jgi:hypothetical protein
MTERILRLKPLFLVSALLRDLSTFAHNWGNVKRGGVDLKILLGYPAASGSHWAHGVLEPVSVEGWERSDGWRKGGDSRRQGGGGSGPLVGFVAL